MITVTAKDVLVALGVAVLFAVLLGHCAIAIGKDDCRDTCDDKRLVYFQWDINGCRCVPEAAIEVIHE